MNLTHPARALALAMVLGSGVALAACGGDESAEQPAVVATEAPAVDVPVEMPTMELVVPMTDITSTTSMTTTTSMTSTTSTTSTTNMTSTDGMTSTGAMTGTGYTTP